MSLPKAATEPSAASSGPAVGVRASRLVLTVWLDAVRRVHPRTPLMAHFGDSVEDWLDEAMGELAADVGGVEGAFAVAARRIRMIVPRSDFAITSTAFDCVLRELRRPLGGDEVSLCGPSVITVKDWVVAYERDVLPEIRAGTLALLCDPSETDPAVFTPPGE